MGMYTEIYINVDLKDETPAMPWIDAYEGNFIGYMRYEEDDMPTLANKAEGGSKLSLFDRASSYSVPVPAIGQDT